MSSILYLLLTGAKNGLKELVKKPSKLILYLIIVGILVMVIVTSNFTRAEIGSFQPLFWLELAFFAFLMMFVILSIKKGLTSGDTIFDMNDVNLLFVSPVDARKILIYGLTRLTKTSFLAGFFLLFQASSLGNLFGINFGQLLILFGIFMLSMIASSILSLVIYSTTNGKAKAKRIVKMIAVLVFVPLVIYLIMQILAGQELTALAEIATNSPYFNFIPIAGWAAHATIAIFLGNLFSGLLYLAIIVVFIFLLMLYITLARVDYYEDVLVATETAFQKKRAIAEGNINAASNLPSKVKVAGTGISGQGVSAIFFKHVRESFRESRVGFFSLSSLILLAGVIVFAFLMRGNSNIAIILYTLMWVQLFLVGTSRGLKEIYSHYIYMIPQASLKKIVWSNLEGVLKTLAESLIMFIAAGIILDEGLLLIVGAIVTYSLFTLFLLGINYFFMRWTSTNVNNGLVMVIYMLSVLVAIAPGAVPAIIVGFSIGGNAGQLLSMVILSVWELIAALILFAMSKGALENCDMPTMPNTGRS